jgi:outer membrane protein OmpA-like peptidoglycan-associated protein
LPEDRDTPESLNKKETETKSPNVSSKEDSNIIEQGPQPAKQDEAADKFAAKQDEAADKFAVKQDEAADKFAVKQDKAADKTPDKKLIAKVSPQAADIAESTKFEEIEKAPVDKDNTQENQPKKQKVSVEMAAEKAIDNHIENFYIDEKNEKINVNAPLIEDLSVIGGKILIYFNYDSLELSEQSRETLRIILDIISKYPNSSLLIEGYTDAAGNYWYNEKLSQARADVVKTYFNKKGISPLRITASGKGSENPRGNNKTAEGRRKNRRVEIKIEM